MFSDIKTELWSLCRELIYLLYRIYRFFEEKVLTFLFRLMGGYAYCYDKLEKSNFQSLFYFDYTGCFVQESDNLLEILIRFEVMKNTLKDRKNFKRMRDQTRTKLLLELQEYIRFYSNELGKDASSITPTS